MDSHLFNNDAALSLRLTSLQLSAREANEWAADLIGINRSTAVTCVKPSGNSSTLLDCSPGIHPRYAPYYIRRARVNTSSSMYWALFMSGIELTPENGQEEMENPSMYVAKFYVAAPEGATCVGDRSAVEQLDYWLKVKTFYTEHNPSATITYHHEELEDIIDWLTENQAYVNGLSFLPASDIMYNQAPYEAISREEYEEAVASQPNVDFDKLLPMLDAGMDNTKAAQELACFAGQCDVI